MKISVTMMRKHLLPVTAGYFAKHNVAPQDIADYGPFAEGCKESAEKAGDLAYFKVGLKHVLCETDEPCLVLNGGNYAFGEQDMRDMLEIVWETIWPSEAFTAGKLPKVELVEMPTEEWTKVRSSIRV